MIFRKYTKWIPLYNYDSFGDRYGNRNRLVQMRRNIETGLIHFRTNTIYSGGYKSLGLDPALQFRKILETKKEGE